MNNTTKKQKIREITNLTSNFIIDHGYLLLSEYFNLEELEEARN